MTALHPIVTVSGDHYESAVDAANDAGGSVQAILEHLARYDFGLESDAIAVMLGTTTSDAALASMPQQLHEGYVGDVHYWLQIDHANRMYSLYREPSRRTEQEQTP